MSSIFHNPPPPPYQLPQNLSNSRTIKLQPGNWMPSIIKSINYISSTTMKRPEMVTLLCTMQCIGRKKYKLKTDKLKNTNCWPVLQTAEDQDLNQTSATNFVYCHHKNWRNYLAEPTNHYKVTIYHWRKHKITQMLTLPL